MQYIENNSETYSAEDFITNTSPSFIKFTVVIVKIRKLRVVRNLNW